MSSEARTKPCAVCGRTIEWRKKWERSWDDVRYCSDGCRRRKLGPVDAELEQAILHLLGQRTRGAKICPSEAAKAVGGHSRSGADEEDEDGDKEAWRELMEPSRMAARRLVALGEIVITQKGRVVDPSTAKGPIRLRKC